MTAPAIHVHHVFDEPTSTLTYVVWDALTRDAVIIDPVMEFVPTTQMLVDAASRQVLNFVLSKGLRVHWILETHAHADHLSAGRELRAWLPHARWGMGSGMRQVFATFHKLFRWPQAVGLERLGVDHWFNDGEEFSAGSLRLQALATPGHTAACVTYVVGPNLFCGDALMMPDSGVGRCDFPGGSAGTLYDSVWGRLFAMPDNFQVYVGHDYQPNGRSLRVRASVREQREGNIHLRGSTSRAEFIAFREARDKTLTPPRLLNVSLDWNLGAHQIVPLP